MLLHHDQVTVANGKVVMQYIIDGDTRMPTEIAEELGLTTTVTIGQDVQDAVKEVVSANPDIVKKILDGNDRPIMSLVGKAVKATNRRGDPVVIKSLIQDAIDAKRSTHKKEDTQE
jgi:Asp-tRNA(Asn)/Glu-tRNA(Gln) amidotransferase B subunit